MTKLRTLALAATFAVVALGAGAAEACVWVNGICYDVCYPGYWDVLGIWHPGFCY